MLAIVCLLTGVLACRAESAENHQPILCKDDECKDCSPIPCGHGTCTQGPACLCFPCWSGASCDVFEDGHLPVFRGSGLTARGDFRAEAWDADLAETCGGQEPCDCARVRYELTKGTELFAMDPTSGAVGLFPGMSLPPQGAQLTVRAASWHTGDFNDSSFLHVTLLPQDSPHRRSKRQSDDTDNYRTEFTLEEAEAPSGDRLEVGRWVRYKLTVRPPATPAMDLALEIFTRDDWTDAYSPTLALFDVSWSGPLAPTEPELRLFPSASFSTVYDRARLELGEISSAGGPEDVLEITWGAVMIRNAGTDFSKRHRVTVGAEYDNQKYVWVGQADVAAVRAKEEEDKRPMKLDIRGPDSIAMDSAGVFYLDAFLGLRSDTVTVEVAQVRGPEWAISTGSLGLTALGEHFSPVPPSPYLYNATFHFVGTETEDTRDRASLEMGLLTNIGPPNQAAEDDKNKIIFTFALYALNRSLEEEETRVTVNVSVTLSGGVAMEHLLREVVVSPRDPRPTPTEVLWGRGAVPHRSLHPGQLAVFSITAAVQEDGFLEPRVAVTPPRGALAPCRARLLRVPLSFDLPYVNSSLVPASGPDAEGRFMFVFPRTQLTDQRTPAQLNDTLLEIEVLATVTNHQSNKPGRQLAVMVEVGDAVSPQMLPVDLEPITVVAPPPPGKPPSVAMVNAAQWAELYPEGTVAFNVTLESPLGAGYPNMLFEANGTHPGVHICQARVAELSPNMPCLDSDFVNNNATFLPILSSPPGVRAARMEFGNTGCVHSPLGDPETGGRLTVRVAVGADHSLAGGDNEVVRAGFFLTSDLVWAGLLHYPAPGGPAPRLPQALRPTATARLVPEGPTPPGEVMRLEITLQTAPNSLGPYDIEVTTEGPALSICVLQVSFAGDHLPCVDPDKLAEYESHEDSAHGVKAAALRFNALGNIGLWKIPDQGPEGPDILVAVATIRVATSATGDASLKWRVNVGDDPQPQRLEVPVGPRLASATANQTQEVVRRVGSSRVGQSGAPLTAPLSVFLDLELDFLSQSPASGELRSSLPARLCLAGVNFRGANYPCLFPADLIFTANSSQVTTFDLGTVCNAAVDKNHPEQNKIQLGLSLLPSLGEPPNEDWELSGHFTVGGRRYPVEPLAVPLMETAGDLNAPSSPEVALLNDSASLPVRGRGWLYFNVTVPRDAVARLAIAATGAERGGRAILTVHGLRFVSAGRDIPCPPPPGPVPAELSRTVPTTQLNRAEASLGYFSNLGLTHGSNDHQAWDDHVTLAVEVGMTDHPVTAAAGSTHALRLDVTLGGVTSTATYPVTVQRDGTERSLLEAGAEVIGPRTSFQRGEKVPVAVKLRHTPESRAEPRAIALRLYLPPYLSLDGMTSLVKINLSATPELATEEGGVDIKLPFLVFEDELEMRLTLLADPNNRLGFGRGEVPATVPYRALCQLASCSLVGHFSLNVNSQECYEPLGLGHGGGVQDCQITADTAATMDRAPYKARLGAPGKLGWSPAVRPGSLQRPYLQVDFLRRVRVARVEVERVGGALGVSRYSLLYGDTGTDWAIAREEVELDYGSGSVARDQLPRPVQARYLRFRVDQAGDSQYLVVRLEMYGCQLEDPAPTATCQNDTTWYSTDPSRPGRHFLVDVKNDIVYFCDLDSSFQRLQCYSSTDGGRTWRGLGRIVQGLVGHGASRTYVRGRGGMLATDDGGETWTAVGQGPPAAMEAPVAVPALARPDLSKGSLAAGNWHATFDGLHYKGSKEVVARWNQCCLQ